MRHQLLQVYFIIIRNFQSNIELNDIQLQLIDLQKQCSQGGVNYFTIILGELNQTIDRLYKIHPDDVLDLDQYKKVIHKFEKARADFLGKIQGNENKPQAITTENVKSLEIIFSQLRYLLTRFGRVINFVDALNQAYKRKQFTNSNSFKLQAPVIKRILEQESMGGNDSDNNNYRGSLGRRNLRSPSSNSSHSSNKYSLSLASTNKETNQTRDNASTMTNYGGERYTYLKNQLMSKDGSVLNQSLINQDKIREILEELTHGEKRHVFEKYMINLSQKWRDEYEDERKNKIPTIVCRVCSKDFYVDKQIEHSKYCVEKIAKQKEQYPQNQKFLEISNKLTECMVHVQKTNVMNTPRITATQKLNILQTPTLMRRALPQLDCQSVDGAEATQIIIQKGSIDQVKLENNDASTPSFKNSITVQEPVLTLKKNTSLVPMLNLSKVPQLQHANTQKNLLATVNPFQKLQMLAAGNVQLQNQQKIAEDSKLNTYRNSLLLPAPLTSKGDNKKVSSTMNTLRGLEKGKEIKQFENLGTSQPSSFISSVFVDTSSAQAKNNENDQSKNLQDDKEDDYEELKIEENSPETKPKANKRLTEEFKQLKIQEIKNQTTLPKVEEMKVIPMKNYLASITSIRQNKGPEQKKIEIELLGKAQTTVQADKKIANNQVKQEKSKKLTLADKKSQNHNISSLNLPQSPYLTAMKRRFENNVNNQSNKTSTMNIDEISNKNQITSPFVKFSKEMPKEMKREYLQKLKNHVESITKKVDIKPKDQKSAAKNQSISNAFTLDIKNQKEESQKNIDNLRKSVKLKKRANPLEKIITKLIISEVDEQPTPNFQKISSFRASPAKQMNLNRLSSSSLQNAQNPQNSDSGGLQSFKISKLNHLQSIIEDNEDEHIQNNNQNSNNMLKIEEQKSISSISQQNEGQDLRENIDKKIEDLGKLPKNTKFTGMSPIITFRALNKFSNDQSSQNTPLSTPQIMPRNAFSYREGQQNLNDSFNNDDISQHQLHLLQNAKKELDLLENLKTMAIEIFNIGLQIKSSKQQLEILKKHHSQLNYLMLNENLSVRTQNMVESFVQTINEKVMILEQLEELDRQYFKTLPQSAKQTQLQDEKINKNLLQRKMNTSVQSRDNLNASPGKNMRRSSAIVNVNPNQGVFFPPGFSNSPRKELSQQQIDAGFFGYLPHKNESLFKQQKQENKNFSEINNSPISYPSDSPYISGGIGDPLQRMRQKQTSATPLLQSRSIQNLYKADMKQLQNSIPAGLFSISQISSPIMKDQFQNTRQRDLELIVEEKGFQDSINNIPQSSKKLPYCQESKKKSYFSTQAQKMPPTQKISRISCIQGGSQSPMSKGSIISPNSKSHKRQSSEEYSVSDSNQSEEFETQSIDHQYKVRVIESPEPPELNLVQKKSTFSKNNKKDSKDKQFLDLGNIMELKKMTFPQNMNSGDNIDHQESQRTSLSDRNKFIFHQRNYSCNEKGSQKSANTKSPRRKSQYMKNISEFKGLKTQDSNLSIKHECQSDIVVGNNYEKEFESVEENETFSDYHEMFFVNELFKDNKRFESLLFRIRKRRKTMPDEIDDLDLDDDDNNQRKQSLNLQDLKIDESDEDNDGNEDQDVLTMSRVRFNSVCVLPSQIDSCSLENYEKHNDQVTIHDFILLKTISKGAYGKVILARKKNTSDLFAVKVLDKEKMVEKNVTEYVMNEKDILNQMSNEFIVRGVYTFQSKKYLYMVMEFMKGGDFAALLEQFGYFDEDTAKYYLAQIVLALEYLHQNGVIHRDLKPDNVLIDADGHIKLTDFGLSEAGLKHFKETVQRENINGESGVSLLLHNDKKDLDMQKDIQNVLGLETLNLIKETQDPLGSMKRIKTLPSGELSPHTQEEFKKAPTVVTAHSKFGESLLPILHANTILHHDQPIRRKNSAVDKDKLAKKRILGTADYMAPEVIQGKDHTYVLDFWSLGVVAYEFLTGGLPFNDESPEKVFKRILNRQLTFPEIGTDDGQITPQAFDFINRLLTSDPANRLGAKGINEIKHHPLFSDIDWENLMDSEPPFKPVGRDQDATYFPNATDKDEELKVILNDQPHIHEKQIVQEFNKFDSVSYNALTSINAKEAKKAIIRAEKQNKQSKQPKNKSSMFDESILQIDFLSLHQYEHNEEFKEMDDEETPSVNRRKN
ncbi:kinase superfamily protein isoform 1 [Stylonychia lemnae]|uniref:non-specific serine/threonine protein kinase n=1 Tax=Stylonychia lemnae TaxID=5949 RepID=A0A078ACR5_STYLE|nr:kinase superfamily protein isoform 1 [Stylonychia lemnae]|eukprot:CDW79969.1 kinase superfamily protein isoform 1 [Stylonychia lemnae]